MVTAGSQHDAGALPGDRELREVCAAAGLDHRGALLLHTRSNAVYHLPQEDLVLRLASSTPAQVQRAHTVVRVCRWLARRDAPVVPPAVLRQPVQTAGTVASAWPYLPPSRPATAADLGAAVQQLHEQAASSPPLPDYQPLVRLREALTLDATRNPPAICPHDHAWLADRVAQLCHAYTQLRPSLTPGLVHGDAHIGNLLYDPQADRWVLIDFDHVARGPRELDLLYAAEDHFHVPAVERGDFTRGYGYDLLTWSGWKVLRDIRELHGVASYIRRAPTNPDAADQLAHRVHSLRTSDRTVQWNAVS
ncbi:MAG: phosphotransferase enzyme family protein [Pseudonocardia sp.]